MQPWATAIDRVLTGPAVPYTRPGTHSAIAKQPLAGVAHVGVLGIAGDEQGDRRVHGGPDKALHHYAFDHYLGWRRDLGDSAVLARPGAFGENLSTRGLTEADVCIGDRLRIGSVLLEVSQSRQPCWKLNDRFGVADMALRVQQSGRTGWYYRVLEPGTLQAGDALNLVARPYPGWSLLRLIDVLYRQPLDVPVLEAMQALPLTPSWRRLVARRLASRQVEDWSARIGGAIDDE